MGILTYTMWHGKFQQLASIFNPRVRLCIVILLMVLPAVLMLLYIMAYGVNVPVADKWGMVPLFDKLYSGDSSVITDLWAQHGNHRMPVPRLVILLLGVVTHWNNIAEMFLRWFFMCLICYVLLRAYMRTCGSTAFALAKFIPVVWIIFWLRPYRLIIGSGDIGMGMHSFFFILALYLLVTTRTLKGRFAIAGISGVVSSLSFTAGLLVWPVGLIVILWFRRSQIEQLKRLYSKMAFIWCAVGACIFAVYYIGYTRTTYELPLPAFVSSVYHHFPYYCKFFVASIGNVFTRDLGMAEGIGLLLLLMYVCVGLYALTRRPRPQSSMGLFLSLIIFALVYALLVTYGRSRFGLAGALAARWTPMSALGIIGLYLLMLSIEVRYKNLKPFLIGFVLSLVAIGAYVPISQAMEIGTEIRDSSIKGAYYLSTYELQSNRNLAKLVPYPILVRKGAPILKKYNLSVFSKPRLEPEKLGLAEGATLSSVDAINGHLLAEQDAPIVIDAQKEDTITISGWAVDQNAGRAAGGVFINIDGQIDIPTIYGSYRNDVSNVLKNSHYRYSGFWASFGTFVLAQGQHVISLKIISADMMNYYEGSQQVILEIS